MSTSHSLVPEGKAQIVAELAGGNEVEELLAVAVSSIYQHLDLRFQPPEQQEISIM